MDILFLLGGIAIKALNDYIVKKKAGQDSPSFKAADIGLTNTELWK